ncbi:MAG: DUF58 domain-containing protein [Clostridium sp.]|nr:DUF58 domain-containing protein [Acetatifactor muris]MCM1527506.1 DUF58 domain-containing protein [Bacteroides sp.]MCM1563748.1 DUF58 domain-containing protein [Clostridium sp.]
MKRKLRLSIKGALRFFILFALFFWMWNYFRSYMLFMGMILLACGAVISVGLLWYNRDRLCVEAVLPTNRVGRDTSFSFNVRVGNPGRLAGFTAEMIYSWKNVFTGYAERKRAHLWVAPSSGSEIRHFLSSRYAGLVEVGIEEFRVYDLLHLFYLTDCRKTGADVIVWPGFAEGEDREEIYSFVQGFPKENEIKRRGTDYNPEYEIREYIPGDELKSIHWKLSAKQGKWMVRERLATGREKINVLLPLGEDREQNDGLMESLYGLCRLLLSREYPIQLYWPGRGSAERAGVLRGRFVAEQGELEYALSEILSSSGLYRPGFVEEQMSIEHPGESYIRVQTGEYRGAYIQ